MEKTIYVRVPAELHARTKAEAKRRDLTISQVVREALRTHVGRGKR